MHFLKVFLIFFYIISPDITYLGFVVFESFFNICSFIRCFTLEEIGWPFKLDLGELVQQSQVLSGNEKEDDRQTFVYSSE